MSFKDGMLFIRGAYESEIKCNLWCINGLFLLNLEMLRIKFELSNIICFVYFKMALNM